MARSERSLASAEAAYGPLDELPEQEQASPHPLPERDCPFCDRIRKGEFDYSDDEIVAFSPLSPVTPGHFLVVPRLHVSHALASPGLAGRTLKFAGYLANQMDLDAVNFITSAGRDATQTVFHLNVHIIPRRPGDGLALPWTGQGK